MNLALCHDNKDVLFYSLKPLKNGEGTSEHIISLHFMVYLTLFRSPSCLPVLCCWCVLMKITSSSSGVFQLMCSLGYWKWSLPPLITTQTSAPSKKA